MKDFNEIQFTEATERILGLLAKMKIDLDEYRQRADANEKYIEKNERILTLLLKYVTEAVPGIIQATTSAGRDKFTAGYETGYKDCKKIYTWSPHKYFDREQFRTYWELKLKSEMPQLF